MKKVLIYLLMGSSCYAGAGLVTGTLSPVINTNTGGGSGTNTFTNVTKAVQSPAYFGDLNNNVIVSQATLGTAAFPGQMVMTYDSSIGGDFSGQLFFAGADLTWRRDVQMGKITIYNSNGVDPDALIVKAAGGSDNCITIQNQDAAHFSAMRFVGKDTGERGAVGYGNTNAAIYADCDFVESFANAYGFYFGSKGFINGGLQRATGNFVWYSGNAGTNDTSATVEFLVTTNGTVTANGKVSATNFTYGYGNVNMHAGAGNPIAVVEGTRVYLDPGELDPNGTLNITNISIANGIAGGAPSGIQCILFGGLDAIVFRRYGLYTQVNGGEWMRMDPAQQLGVNNITLTPPSGVVMVNSTNTGDTTTTFQVVGNSSATGFITHNTNLFAIQASGWTNTNSFNCTGIVHDTGQTITISDGTNTVDTLTLVTGLVTVSLAPNEKFTSASGLSGNMRASR